MTLAGDGRHVWLGRGTDPTDDELGRIGAALDAQAATAWLVLVRGDYWDAADSIETVVARRLTSRHEGALDDALEAWNALRRKALTG